ncbi:MAG: HNH endonuclease domain-containing protein [Crocosphaera sp.]
MVNQFHQLPNDEQLNIAAFSRLFNQTTNSYKYLFFLSLLDILARGNFSKLDAISFQEIIVEMLANAWYPHTYFKLSFGTQDQITHKLDSLNLEISEPILKFTDPDKKCLRKTIASEPLDDIINYFKKYVPFRLLCPFLEQELKKEKISRGRGNDLDRAMPWVVDKYFEAKKPLYHFNSTEQSQCHSIIFHPEWAEYIEKNYSIVKGWVSWEWLTYMQSKNPNITNVVNKLFIPQKRDSLSKQTKYWKSVLKYQELECIYSRVKLEPNSKISLDHYLPWSFVAHDQLWNLIPTIPSVNSSKSNNIPADQYFEKFVKLQHLGLTISHQQTTQKSWLRKIESYIADLKVDNADDLLDLEIITKAYENTIFPLISLANTQGFSSNWIYSNTQNL